MLALGWAVFPILFRVFRWLPDRGFSFSKAAGLLLTSYLVWLGASTGFLRNDSGSFLVALGILIAISLWLLFRQRGRDEAANDLSLSGFLRQNKSLILAVEILFAVAFLAWALLRAYAPDKVMSAGGEKFMEMAFLNGTLNSPNFPPIDPWLSGYAISYYYYGYVMLALLTRLTGAVAGVGFDLYDALLFALTIIGSFGVVYNLVALSRKPGKGASVPIGFGLLASFFVALLGNLEGFLELLYARGAVSLAFWKWIDVPGLLENPVTGSWFPGGSNGWWWWRASRVIQDRDLLYQPLGLSPINEFPFFSFLLGDNHPHVLALPFVLLAIGLGLNLLVGTLARNKTLSEDHPSPPWWHVIANSMHGSWPLFIFYSLSLGALGFLNTWDMPIYVGIVTLTYGIACYAQSKTVNRELMLKVLALGGSLLVASIGLYIPFYVSFHSQAGGILPYVFPPTRLPQYLVMFGTYIFLISAVLIAYILWIKRHKFQTHLFRSLLKSWGIVIGVCLILIAVLISAGYLSLSASRLVNNGQLDPSLQNALGGSDLAQVLQSFVYSRLTDPWLFLLATLLIAFALTNLAISAKTYRGDSSVDEISQPLPADWFVFLMIFTGLALTFFVEIAYLRDSFMARMNTVFKFYFQGWVLMGLSSAYGLWWLSDRGKVVIGRIGYALIVTGVILLVFAGSVYTVFAGYSRVNGFRSAANLDGTSNLRADSPDDWAAIDWLRNEMVAQRQEGNFQLPVILEAPGKSYNYEGRISAFSGVPALLGWSLHEGQWRGNYTEQGVREPDIDTIYSTPDASLALELLHNWNVKYVVVGQPEINYIQTVCQTPGRACNLASALRKFELGLTPVFQQGNTTIYLVP